MAGSEQMNFLVSTNYSSAKVNLEQLKQQVPNRENTYHNGTKDGQSLPSNWKTQHKTCNNAES